MCALCLSKLKYSYIHIWLHIKLIKICPFPSRQTQDQNKYFRCQLFSINQLVYGWASIHRWASSAFIYSNTHLLCTHCFYKQQCFLWASLVAQRVKICLQCRRPCVNPCVRKIPWRREWLPSPVSLPGDFHGQRNLLGCSPWGGKESDTTERLTLSVSFFHCSLNRFVICNKIFKNLINSKKHRVSLKKRTKSHQLEPEMDPYDPLLWSSPLLLSPRSVVSDSLRPHGLQHVRLSCASLSPGACSNSYPESVMPSNHLILCHPLLLLPSIFPSIRVFSNESVLCIRQPKHWSFSFSISPSNEYSGLISFRMDWLGLLAVQVTLKSLLQQPSFESINSLALSLLYGPTLTSVRDYWENHSFD